MMEILVQAGEGGGGCTPAPFHYIHVQSCSVWYAPAEWADTLALFQLYQYMYSVGMSTSLWEFLLQKQTCIVILWKFLKILNVLNFDDHWHILPVEPKGLFLIDKK